MFVGVFKVLPLPDGATYLLVSVDVSLHSVTLAVVLVYWIKLKPQTMRHW